ncbi:hypothetical protein AX16_009384 [Volvariella volvacea WC 439]|nr:hypothetical protein AX16_009384 [Volvariella volvacea WC 439]
MEKGVYKISGPNNATVRATLTKDCSRPRAPTASNTESTNSAYTARCRERDPCCLVPGERIMPPFYTRFEVTHIWPRAHDDEWNKRGYPYLVNDPAPLKEVGGATKIDSIQNVITLRSDLHRGWDNYEFGVDPDDGYKVVPFIAGYDSIAGNTLNLYHIQDQRLRPLDALLRDHFMQGVLRHVKGAGEPPWDYEDTFGEGSFDLSAGVWSTEQGRTLLELDLKNRLHGRFVTES